MERAKKQTKRLSKSVHPRNIPSARMGLSPTTPIDATTRECCFPDCAGPSTAMAVPLPNSTSHVTMSPATPEKPARIGRKSMSRRSGQSGSIQKEGNWYVVRYWKDVAGQEKRKRVYERICPISGPGKLSASERERKAKERSEEHTSELQSRLHLVCRLLLEKKKEDSYLLLPMIQAVIS